jgi:hypothetical protein
MENKYVYKGQDITTDVIMKIEKITRLIAERESCQATFTFDPLATLRIDPPVSKSVLFCGRF